MKREAADRAAQGGRIVEKVPVPGSERETGMDRKDPGSSKAPELPKQQRDRGADLGL